MTFSSSAYNVASDGAGYPAAYNAGRIPPFSSAAVGTPTYLSAGPGTGGVIPVSYRPISPVYPQYYCVQPLPPEAEQPRKCLLRIVCEAVGWLTSAVLCTLCSAVCGAASCCIDALQEEECLPGPPQQY